MSEPNSSEFRPPEQLEFLAILGLVPPVSVEDVKQAYLEKAKTAHPDAGGNAERFKQLQEAFEQATEYARFKTSRMQWLAHWVEQYAEQDQLINQVKELGGTVDVKSSDPMSRTIGPDFAVVLDKVTGIHLKGPKVTDDVLKQLSAAAAVGGLAQAEPGRHDDHRRRLFRSSQLRGSARAGRQRHPDHVRSPGRGVARFA